MKVLRKYSALVLLVLFVYPYIEKGIHDWEHADDLHCIASTMHFHEAEHSCSVCDYITPVSTQPSAIYFSLSATVFEELVISYTAAGIVSAPDYFFSLRAPPALV